MQRDEDHAADLKRAVDLLNATISCAVADGLTVRVEIMQVVGVSPAQRPMVQAELSRVLYPKKGD